jgi:hypothetical protein
VDTKSEIVCEEKKKQHNSAKGLAAISFSVACQQPNSTASGHSWLSCPYKTICTVVRMHVGWANPQPTEF